jgi:hypothetical protein
MSETVMMTDTEIADKFMAHVAGLHNADFEVCENPECELAYFSERWKELTNDGYDDTAEYLELLFVERQRLRADQGKLVEALDETNKVLKKWADWGKLNFIDGPAAP